VLFGEEGGEGRALSCAGVVGAVWVYDVSGVVRRGGDVVGIGESDVGWVGGAVYEA
jgi:hypothetical protein